MSGPGDWFEVWDVDHGRLLARTSHDGDPPDRVRRVQITVDLPATITFEDDDQ